MVPSFQALHHQAAATVVFYAFDLLHVDGRDLLKMPLDERRAALAPVVQRTAILRSEPLPGTPEQIEAAVRRLQLEGVVAKQRLSRYEPGRRSHAWVKVKFNRRQEFVIGGLKPNATSFESLLVGYYEGNKLHFVRQGPRRPDATRAPRNPPGDCVRQDDALFFVPCGVAVRCVAHLKR